MCTECIVRAAISALNSNRASDEVRMEAARTCNGTCCINLEFSCDCTISPGLQLLGLTPQQLQHEVNRINSVIAARIPYFWAPWMITAFASVAFIVGFAVSIDKLSPREENRFTGQKIYPWRQDGLEIGIGITVGCTLAIALLCEIWLSLQKAAAVKAVRAHLDSEVNPAWRERHISWRIEPDPTQKMFPFVLICYVTQAAALTLANVPTAMVVPGYPTASRVSAEGGHLVYPLPLLHEHTAYSVPQVHVGTSQQGHGMEQSGATQANLHDPYGSHGYAPPGMTVRNPVMYAIGPPADRGAPTPAGSDPCGPS